MSQQVQLSAIIITFNEEKNIARCLDSLIGIADDIVVVDSFSTDATERICKEKGVRFVQHAFEGYIQQKNWSVTQAKYPFVLSLDADEALSDELKTSIIKTKNNWTHDGYFMNRMTNYCGQWIRHTAWYPDRKLRLWDSRKGKWAGMNPHDKFEMEPNAKTSHIKGDLLHYSYYTVDDHLKQIDHFTTISAKAMYDNNYKPSFIKKFISPVASFVRDYVLYMGFMEGYYGWVLSKNSARTTFLKYHKLSKLYKERKA